MEQMLDAARVLCDQPLPCGNRVVVVGNSGGPGILAADAAVRAGLDVVTLRPETEQQLRQAVPTAASCRNPVDLGAAVRPAQLDAALRVLLDAAEVDSVLPVLTDTAITNSDEVMSGIAAAAAVAATDKPVVVTRVGGEQGSIPIVGSDRMVPVFTFPEPAAAALGTAWRYSRLRSAPVTPVARPTGIDEDRHLNKYMHAHRNAAAPAGRCARAPVWQGSPSESSWPTKPPQADATLRRGDPADYRLGSSPGRRVANTSPGERAALVTNCSPPWRPLANDPVNGMKDDITTQTWHG